VSCRAHRSINGTTIAGEPTIGRNVSQTLRKRTSIAGIVGLLPGEGWVWSRECRPSGVIILDWLSRQEKEVSGGAGVNLGRARKLRNIASVTSRRLLTCDRIQTAKRIG